MRIFSLIIFIIFKGKKFVKLHDKQFLRDFLFGEGKEESFINHFLYLFQMKKENYF